jgi:hypothetical protein
MKKLLSAIIVLASCAAAVSFGPWAGGARQSGSKQSGARPESKARAGSKAQAESKTVDAERLLEDVRLLSADAMEGRGTGTQGGAMARAFVVRRFAELGLKAFGDSFEKPFRVAGGRRGGRPGAEVSGVNVVGYVQGRAHPERYIVVTAHYDHLGVRGGQVYNGADDNASGVAALLQLAAHFSRERPDNSLIFAALDAEEIGLLGARSLVAWLREQKLDAALDVNMDMVSHSERGELYAAGIYPTPALAGPLKEVAARSRVRLLLGHDRPEQGHDDWTNQSDQFAFKEAGVPFVYFGVEDHEDYHKPSDDFDTLTRDFFVGAAETVLEAVRALDADLDAAKAKR